MPRGEPPLQRVLGRVGGLRKPQFRQLAEQLFVVEAQGLVALPLGVRDGVWLPLEGSAREPVEAVGVFALLEQVCPRPLWQ